MERFSTFLNKGHGLKDKVCHKILFKIIIATINGKILKIFVLMGIIIGNNLSKVGSNPNKVGSNLNKVGNNPNKVGSNVSRVGSSLSRVGSKPKIGITNLVSKP